ncbi:hypothetical protein BG006_007495 [Podila minutissima]|uniref:Uncharacterized protein n=1 Tax=Podila minutissima TaxID=64525 RepID=A0A9P5SL03_9FUNG|nr:hypothetical protein BG006_007495 [Podila minutissima]
MTTPMIMFGRFNNEPGEKRALLSSLCWLRDYIDGHAVLGEDICWSDDDPGSEFYQQRYDRNVLSYPFFEFWDEAWESLATKNLVGVMCIIPQEFRGVATVGSGFVCASVPSFDPHETLDVAEFLGAILCSMFMVPHHARPDYYVGI